MAAAIGLAFGLLGTALLLQELGLLAMRWSVVVPLVLLAVGVLLLVSGVLGSQRTSGTTSAPPHL
jgi:hypothetical protein